MSAKACVSSILLSLFLGPSLEPFFNLISSKFGAVTFPAILKA